MGCNKIRLKCRHCASATCNVRRSRYPEYNIHDIISQHNMKCCADIHLLHRGKHKQQICNVNENART